MATTVGNIEVIAKIDTSGYKKGASEIDKSNAEIDKSAEKTTKNIGSRFDGAAKIATGAILAAGAVITKTFVQSASEIQSLRASFESLTGSTENTNAVMSTLYDLGRKTAFENKDIQAAGRNYLAAGVAVKDLNSVLTATADIAGATGADLGQLTLPLTQTIARGKLQTQDFYQILNSGAGALRKPLTELAGEKGFGSLAEAMEQGAITSDDLLSVMQNVTKEGGFAFEGALKQSKTFNGQMSNLRESVTNFGLDLLGIDATTGEIDPSGPFAKMSNAIETATEFLTNNGETIKQIGTVIAIFLTPAIISLGVQGLLAGARLAAGILLALGPIGLIAAAVGAAVYLIVKNWDTIKEVAGAVWEWIKNAASAAWDWIKDIFGGIGNWFSDKFSAIRDAISGVFDSVKKKVGDIWDWIKGVFGTIGSVAETIIKAPVNAIIGFAENTLNGFIRAINGAIGAINKIPGVDIGHIGEINIPKLATGGIISSPTLAMIGEGNEPEAVIPLSKLDKLITENRQSSNIPQSNNAPVRLDLGGSPAFMRQIATDIIRSYNEVMRSRGMPEIGVA